MIRQVLAEMLIISVLVVLLIGLTATAGIPSREAGVVATTGE